MFDKHAIFIKKKNLKNTIMPIRMVEDQNRNSQDNYPGGGGGGGGKLPGGLNSGCLTALLPLLLKNPKLLIIGIVIIAGIYFFGGGKSLLQNSSANLATGASLDPRVYQEAEIFEPLADNVKNPLPEKVSLLKYAPDRLNQGSQGSCVAWSSAYGARSILHARQTGENPDNAAFSPAFLYNQIGLEGCQGSYIIRAMENMQQVGAVPFNDFPYDENDCSRQPDQFQLRKAEEFKIKGFNRLSKTNDDSKVDLLAVKQNLAQGAPVVIGMMVGGSFMQPMMGQQVWVPESSDYEMMGFGGHAMCVIGYDDYLEGGAFQIMNSWGNEWGQDGVGYVRYKDFDYFVKEAYGLYPMGTSEKFDQTKLQAEIGLAIYDDATGVTRDLPTIPLRYRGGLTFATTQPVKKGTTFKIEVTNSVECYIYVFGQETDGSSYVLFPYTPKHSPYCGITGTRLFPRDFSMKADELGNRDFMAIVVTKTPLDYKVINEAISKSRQASYSAKVQEALSGRLLTNVNFSENGNNMAFDTSIKHDEAIAMILEIDKQ